MSTEYGLQANSESEEAPKKPKKAAKKGTPEGDKNVPENANENSAEGYNESDEEQGEQGEPEGGGDKYHKLAKAIIQHHDKTGGQQKGLLENRDTLRSRVVEHLKKHPQYKGMDEETLHNHARRMINDYESAGRAKEHAEMAAQGGHAAFVDNSPSGIM